MLCIETLKLAKEISQQFLMLLFFILNVVKIYGQFLVILQHVLDQMQTLIVFSSYRDYL